MGVSCLPTYRGLLTKNLLIYYRYKLFGGTLLTLALSSLFFVLRYVIVEKIESKNLTFPIIKLPTSSSILTTYLSHLCYPIYEVLFKINTTQTYTDMLNMQILTYIMKERSELESLFSNLKDGSSDKLNLIDICINDDIKELLGDNLDKFVLNFFGKSYNGNEFKRCMNYSELDNIMYGVAKSVSSIHFLASRSIPIFFKTRNSEDSQIKTNLSKFQNLIEFSEQFYDSPNFTEIVNRKWRRTDEEYMYCFDSLKLRFSTMSSEEDIRRLLEKRHDVFFGIIVDESFDEKKFVKFKFISRFENMVGPEDKSLGFLSDTQVKNNKYTASGQLYVQHILNLAALMKKDSETTNLVEEMTDKIFISKSPYRDETYIEPMQFSLIIRNVISLFPFAILPTSGIIIYAISKERELKLDLHFHQMGVNWLHYATSWLISALLLNLITILCMISVIKAWKVFIYTEFSTIIVYGCGFVISISAHLALFSVLTRSFTLNFLIFLSLIVVQQFISGFPQYMNSPNKEFTELLPFVNFGHFALHQNNYEVLHIRNGLEHLNLKIYDDGCTVQSLSLINFVSSIISLSLYLLINFCSMKKLSIPKTFRLLKEAIKGTKKDSNGDPGEDWDEGEYAERFSSKKSEEFQEFENISEPVIKIENLCKSYGSFQVIKNMNLAIPKNCTSILLGKNGCGKTTLINSILGCTPINSGEIKFSRDDSDSDRQKVSYAPQYDPLYPNLTFFDHFLFYGLIYGQSCATVREKCSDWSNTFGMLDFKNVATCRYSGGMRRKLTMALTFSTDSLAVFLDEPTSSIDPIARAEIWKIIDSLNSQGNHSILICTHTPKEADILGQYYIVMDQGTIKKCGFREEVFRSENLYQKIMIFLDYKEITEDEVKNVQQEIRKLASEFNAKILYPNDSCVTLEFLEKIDLKSLRSYLRKIGELKHITSTALSEANSKDLFLSCVKSGDDSICTEYEPSIVFDTERSKISLFMNQIISQFYKIAMMFFSFNQIFIFMFIPILIAILFFSMIYLAKNLYFDIDQLDYIMQAAPGNLRIANAGVTFRLFHFLNDSAGDQQKNPPETVRKLFKFINDQNSDLSAGGLLNVHCIDKYNEQLLAGNGNDTNRAECSILKSTDISNKKFPGQLYEEFSVSDALGGIYFGSTILNHDFLIFYYGAQSRKSAPIILDHFYNQLIYANEKDSFFDGVLYESEVFEKDIRPQLSDDIFNLTVATSLSIVVFMMPTFLSLVVMKEKQSNFKHLLKIQGLPMVSYWLATFKSYLLIFTINLWIIYGLLKSFPGEPLLGNTLPIIILLQNLYLLNALPSMFCCTLICESEFAVSTGFFLYQVWIGMFLGTIMNILKTIHKDDKDYFANDFSKYFFLPPFKYICSIIDIAYLSTTDESASKIHGEFTWEIYQHILYFAIISFMVLIYEHFDDLLSIFKKDHDEYTSDTLLDVRNIHKVYFKKPCGMLSCIYMCIPTSFMQKIFPETRKIKANNNISLKVGNNESHAIVGLNGAGKTTFFDIITNKIKPTSGEVLMNGALISDPVNMRTKIGYCPQAPACLENLTLKQHLSIVYMLKGVNISQINSAVDQCLEFYSCHNLKHKTPSQMSGGGKKKLSLSMINPTGFEEKIPQIFMLDEAIAALDMTSQEMVKNYMSHIVVKNKKTVLFSTHYFNEIEEFAQNITVLKKGEVFFDGSVAEFYGTFQNLFGLSIRFSYGLAKGIKDGFINELLNCLHSLHLRHNYNYQVHFSIVQLKNSDNTESNKSTQNLSIQDAILDILQIIEELEMRVVKENDLKDNFIVNVSCGPFDLEQSFCEQ